MYRSYRQKCTVAWLPLKNVRFYQKALLSAHGFKNVVKNKHVAFAHRELCCRVSQPTAPQNPFAEQQFLPPSRLHWRNIMKKLLLLMVVAIFATANSGCCRQHRLRNLFHRGAVCTPPVLSSVAGPGVMPTVVASPISEGCSGGCNGNCNSGSMYGGTVNGGITEGTVLGGFIDETGGQAGCSSCQANAGSSINYSGGYAPSTSTPVEPAPTVLPSPTGDNET